MGGLKSVLARANIHNVSDIELRRIGNKTMLDPLFLSYEYGANSDYYPVLDLNADRTNFLGASAIDLTGLGRAPLPLADMLSGRQAGLEQIDHISPDRRFKRSMASAFAKMLYRFYLTGEWKWVHDTAGLPRDLAPPVLHGCRPDLPFEQWLDGLINNVGKYVLPYLTVGESRALWKVLEAEACWANLTPVQSEFADLVKAVGERNGQGMAARAERILRSLPQLPPDLVEYVLAVGMLGDLAQDNKAAAKALWRDHASRLGQAFDMPLYIRLLRAHAG
jgi:hypothetical protein